jgi:quinol monooxygenase YgiN
MPIVKTAHFQVKAEALDTAKEVIETFVAYVRANEPNTLIYLSVQSKEDETVFMHYMEFVDSAAEETHRTSRGVKAFVDVLYPVTVDGVSFHDYTLLTTTQHGHR